MLPDYQSWNQQKTKIEITTSTSCIDLYDSQTDPTFQFYVSAIFEDRDNFVSYDQGLLSFIKVMRPYPLELQTSSFHVIFTLEWCGGGMANCARWLWFWSRDEPRLDVVQSEREKYRESTSQARTPHAGCGVWSGKVQTERSQL